MNEHFERTSHGERPGEYDDAHRDARWASYRADVHDLDDEAADEDDDDHPLLEPFTEDEVRSVVSSLKNSGAVGLDGVPTAVLKNADDRTLGHLTRLVNLSLTSGHFPTQGLGTKAYAHFKRKGSPNEPGNYRPIAITSVATKVLEKLLARRLAKHFEDTNRLSPNQGGFRAGMGTAETLLFVSQEWHHLTSPERQNKSRTPVVNAVFLDIAKCFDRIDRRLLLHKLRTE